MGENVTITDSQIKGTGAVYQICVAAMELYYDQQSILWFPKLCAELVSAGYEAKDKNKDFNEKFFAEFSDRVLRIFWLKKLYDIPKDSISPTFQKMWKFHRQWLVSGVAEDQLETVCQTANDMAKEEKPSIQGFYVAVLKDLLKVQHGDAPDEQTKY